MASSTTRHHIICQSVVFALLFSTAAAAQTKVYKYRDENGNMVFSDRIPAEDDAKPASLETIEVPASNMTQPPPEITVTRQEKQSGKSVARYEITITSPADGTTIPMGPGNFVVNARSKPGLAQGEKLQLKIDGAVYGEPQNGTIWQLQNVYRGEHSVMVERIDPRGKILHSASPITVYVLRPSVR